MHKILCFSATTLDDDGGCWSAVGSWWWQQVGQPATNKTATMAATAAATSDDYRLQAAAATAATSTTDAACALVFIEAVVALDFASTGRQSGAVLPPTTIKTRQNSDCECNCNCNWQSNVFITIHHLTTTPSENLVSSTKNYWRPEAMAKRPRLPLGRCNCCCVPLVLAPPHPRRPPVAPGTLCHPLCVAHGHGSCLSKLWLSILINDQWWGASVIGSCKKRRSRGGYRGRDGK